MPEFHANRRRKRHPGRGTITLMLHTLVGEISKIEEQSDQLNDEGLRSLYKAHKQGDALAFVVGAELYNHLERVCDRFEDVAHVIGDIVIEHV